MTNLLIVHINQIATPTGESQRHGAQMNEISLVQDGAIYVVDDLIVNVGKTAEVLADLRKKNITDFDEVIDATGQAVVPGFVDSHTHFFICGIPR